MSKKKEENKQLLKNTPRKLRLPKYHGFAGVFCILLSICAGTAMALDDEWELGLFVFLLCGGAGSVFLTWYINHRISFDNNQIDGVGVYGKRTSIKWDEIQTVSFNGWTGFLSIIDQHGNEIKGHMYIVGLIDLVEVLRVKAGAETADLRLPPLIR